MNKRKIKKMSRNVCPRCRVAYGLWHWSQIRTGRWISHFVECHNCGFTADGTTDPSIIDDEETKELLEGAR